MSWKKIWDSRKIESEITLAIALFLSGYDNENSLISIDSLKDFLERYKKIIEDSILELNCGCGCFLNVLNPKIGCGLDFSETMINNFRLLNPMYDYLHTEAINLDSHFDHIFTFTGFNYLPSKEYAFEVLEKMIIHSRKSIAIFDILDLDLKEKDLEFRKKYDLNFDLKNQETPHLYFSKEWFKDYNVLFPELKIKGYKNSDFRFNILIKK